MTHTQNLAAALTETAVTFGIHNQVDAIWQLREPDPNRARINWISVSPTVFHSNILEGTDTTELPGVTLFENDGMIRVRTVGKLTVREYFLNSLILRRAS